MPSLRGRSIARWMGVAAMAVVAAIVWRQWSASTRPDWNVLLVTLDTTRADRLGCYGYDRAQTPSIDRLSRESVRYTRCYAPAPLTLPSHASLLSGLTPICHGVHVNGEVLSADVLTLPEILQRNGFVTGAVLGAFVLNSQFGLSQGYDYYDDDMSYGHEAGRFYFTERNAQLVTNAAVKWWHQNPGRAKFLWVHYFDPHAPYAAPDYDPTFTTLSDYDAEISYVDRHLRTLLEAIDAPDPNTLVVLASDHGEALGEHGEETHGLFTYEPTLHVPLIVRFPDRRRAGTEIRVPVSLVDVMPSILSWLGLPAVDGLDGEVLPLVAPTPGRPQKDQRAIYFENQFVAQSYGWSALEGVVVGPWKYIRAPRPELYDLSNDPHEKTNLYAVDDGRAARFAERFDDVVAGLTQREAAVGAGDLDDAARRRLESLGYIGTSSGTGDDLQTDAAAAADPKDMVAVYRKIHTAILHADQGRISEAVTLLAPIIDDRGREPPNPRAVRVLATVVAEQPAARKEGIACLERLVEEGDDFNDAPFVLHALGEALIAEGQFDEALEPLGKLLERDAADAGASYQLGRALGGLGRAAEAGAAYRRAIELAERDDAPPDWLPDARRELAALPRGADESREE